MVVAQLLCGCECDIGTELFLRERTPSVWGAFFLARDLGV